jgi:hypothetical protein
MPVNDGGMFDRPGSEISEADQVEDVSKSERDETISWIRMQLATGRLISGSPAERLSNDIRN